MYKTTTKTFLYLVFGAFLATGIMACGDIDVDENQQTNQQNQNDGNDGEGNDGEGNDGEGNDGEGNDGEGNDGEGNDGEGNDGEGNGDVEIEVSGTWETNFGGTEVIDNEWWDFMHMIDFDNTDRWAITQNPDDAEWGAETYNRLVWTPIEDDVFYYCTVDFNLDTEQEARDSDETADESDLDGEGCGGFPWTEMTRQ